MVLIGADDIIVKEDWVLFALRSDLGRLNWLLSHPLLLIYLCDMSLYVLWLDVRGQGDELILMNEILVEDWPREKHYANC